MNSKGLNDLAEKDFTNRFVGLDLILFVIKCINSRAVCFQSNYVKKKFNSIFFSHSNNSCISSQSDSKAVKCSSENIHRIWYGHTLNFGP